jgi:hypothetical protein
VSDPNRHVSTIGRPSLRPSRREAHVDVSAGMCRKGILSLSRRRCRQSSSGSVSAILPHNGHQILFALNSS